MCRHTRKQLHNKKHKNDAKFQLVNCFFDPRPMQAQIESPWRGGLNHAKMTETQNITPESQRHARLFRLQLTSCACNPHPMAEGFVSPPGHVVKIIASGSKGKKDTDVGFWTPPSGTGLKPMNGGFVWKWGHFSGPAPKQPTLIDIGCGLITPLAPKERGRFYTAVLNPNP